MQATFSSEELEAIAQRVANLLQERRDYEGYLSAANAAEFLGLSTAAIYARVGREQIPYLRIGKRILFDRRELRAWVTATHSGGLTRGATGGRE